ncbi:MAG TPA: cellulase family glycosylhydrolase [Chloroflexia bacterium]|jgi:hypothetical protein|nr:cellulase family glycosylhydrolase [Chloroflexia bacterium]
MSLPRTHWSFVRALLLLLLVLAPVASLRPRPSEGASGFVQVAPGSTRFLRPDGRPFFVWAVNYVGAPDRAWRMWEDAQFDPAVIDADFTRAASLGLNTVRLFIQPPLRADVQRNNFRKLDLVVDLARRHGLFLILTFTDYVEPDLQQVADIESRIAAHFRDEATILAYDLKNEPQFDLIALSVYPGAPPPLQTDRLITLYGERISSAAIPAYRQTPEGRALVPARLTDAQAYIYVNSYRLYREFLDAGASWVATHPDKTTLDYMDSPDAMNWRPFFGVLDDTVRRWIAPQRDAIRAVDPNHMLTLAYSNIVLAKLSANRLLDFQSPHRFVATGMANLQRTLQVLTNLRTTFAGQPFMLEEFGYSNEEGLQRGASPVDQLVTANLETAVWLYLYSQGYAGGGKWMLNNFPGGENASQNAYGLYDDNLQPKIAAYALSALMPYMSADPPPGTFSDLNADQAGGVRFAYSAPNARFLGGTTSPAPDVVQYTSNGSLPLLVFLTWQREVARQVDVWTSGPGSVSVNLPATLGRIGPDVALGVRVRQADGTWTPVPFTRNGDQVQIAAAGLRTYRITAPSSALDPAPPSNQPGTIYFTQTRHNLGGGFLEYWRAHGGLPIFGYPLTEEFTEGGYTVQYFERNRFEYHPEYAGTPYSVLLGRLGATVTAGRVFPTIPPFPNRPGHVYFPPTQHSLNSGFLTYWQAHGGLAQFGYPISEEIAEVSPTDGRTYTVQYFERARFEYHPEYAGTPSEVLLGLLGVTVLRDKGWLP